jgi:integrase
MPIVQRGQSFQVTVNHKGKRYRRQWPSHLEAQQWELEAKIALNKGQEPAMGEGATSSGEYRPETLGQLMNYLIDHRWTGTKGEKAAIINAKHIVRVIGAETPLRNVSSHTVNLAVSKLRELNYPEVTINKKVSPLRVALKYAQEQGWIDRLPTMPFFKPGEGRLRYFTQEEEQAMLNWCQQRGQFDLWDYIVVSTDTGLRQGEVLTLKNRNVHAGRVTVWGQRTAADNGTKAGNTRTIPLTARALEVCKRRGTDNPGVLFNFNKDQITRMWNAMRDALGYSDDPEYVPHAMRHTFCSRLVMAKVNLVVVQRLAGHLRIETTCRYVHLDDDALVEAIASLAPRKDSVYEAAPTATPDVPHASVACHNGEVAPNKTGQTRSKVLNMQRFSTAV